MFGGFIKINHVSRQMDEGMFPADRKSFTKASLKGNPYFYPEEKARQFSFSIGIFAAGLFSGVTHATSTGLGTVETGLSDERNKDKRGKIEYKDFF